MTWLYYYFYRRVMVLAHYYDWHYAPKTGPLSPTGDYQRWCQWCGFRQTIPREVRKGERMEIHDDDDGGWVCEHGTALDVHCCNCHRGFFPPDDCRCGGDDEAEQQDVSEEEAA